MENKVYATIVQEPYNDTIVTLKVTSGKKGYGRELYKRKCWNDALAIDNEYKLLVKWLEDRGYEPVYSKGCYEMVLYWEKDIE